ALGCSGTGAMHPRLHNLLLTTAALLALGAAPAAGGPAGGTVVGGTATIQGEGGPAVTVNQSSGSAIINWNTFNIGVNESVRFNQPGASSVVLNRVTGGRGPSEILGTLTANGRVFVINRDGILFGPNAVVNTAGFLATTHAIKHSDFMAGRYNFNTPGRPDASIVNQGRITATSGGFAALVAPGVRNTGTITATLGTVALVSGNSFTLDLYGDKLITLAVNDQIASKVIDGSTGKAPQVAGEQRGQDQSQRRTGRAHRRGGAHCGRFRHQHQRRDHGQLDRPPQRHDRARRRDRGKQAGGRSDSDRQDLRHAGSGGQEEGNGGRHDPNDPREPQTPERADRGLRPQSRRQGADRRRLGRRQSEHEPRQKLERQARKLRDPDGDYGERRRRDHHQRLGEGTRQRRQGRFMVGQRDHLRRD